MGYPAGASTLLLRPPVMGLPDGRPLLSSPGEAGVLTAIITAFTRQSPTYISVLTASGSKLSGGVIKGDS